MGLKGLHRLRYSYATHTHQVLRLVAALLLLGQWSEADARKCGAIYDSNDCQKANPRLPSCVGKPFEQEWWSIYQGSVDLLQSDDNLKSSRYTKMLFPNNERVEGDRGKLAEYDVVGNLTNGVVGSCALVSSSAILLGSRYGQEIDSHDLIMRINRAVTKTHEEDVGKKTTIRYTNSPSEGFREHSSEVGLSKWCAGSPKRHDGTYPCGMKDIQRMAHKKVFPINPYFVESYVKHLPAFKEHKHLPTAGFVAGMFLLHICKKVDIYGFGVARPMKEDSKRKVLKNWYYDKKKHSDMQDSEKFDHVDWEVERWQYLSDAVHGSSRPPKLAGPVKAIKHKSANRSTRRAFQAGVRVVADGASSGTAVPGLSQASPARRLLGSQSDTIMYEKNCMHDLHRAGIWTGDQIKPAGTKSRQKGPKSSPSEQGGGINRSKKKSNKKSTKKIHDFSKSFENDFELKQLLESFQAKFVKSLVSR